MGRLMKRTWWLTRFVMLCVIVGCVECKPANQFPAEANLESSRGTPAANNNGGLDQPQGKLDSKSRAVSDGTWEASARIPASTETGGNEHSRYNIRRDGSLSLSLKSQNDWFRTDRKISPSELRSFSVVLSDVDVIGRYPGGTTGDAFSDAGVTGYQVHSNTIHRMNASWKLNPRRSRISPEELSQFLTYFSKNHQQQQKQNSRHQKADKASEELFTQTGENDMTDLPKFTTWSYHDDANDRNDSQPSSTSPKPKLLFFNGVDRSLDGTNNAGGNNGTNATASSVVLHDLISTLEKLIEMTNMRSENNSSIGQRPEHEVKNGSRIRMSATDPQQTAADLKKLMTLLLKSTNDADKEMSGNGAEVVNVVITPNTATGSSNSTRQDERQKILFLKSPQVKHLLDTALSDPTVSFAAQKIAAALHTSPYEDADDTDDAQISGASMTPGPDSGLATPDGFPLNATGFLNLQHPNLQFHQALHHLLSNGSTPSGINASTKTNVINIFVLNFNSPPGNNINSTITPFENSSPVKLKPPVIYSFGNSPSRPEQTSHDQPAATGPDRTPPFIFFNKLGLPVFDPQPENKDMVEVPAPEIPPVGSGFPSGIKPFIEVTASHGHPYVAVTHIPPILLPTTTTTTETPGEKINILDLLPGSFGGTFTPVDFAGNNPQNKNSTRIPWPINSDHDKDKLESDAAELLSYFSNPEHSVNPIGGGQPAIPGGISPLSWILKQEPPPKPVIKTSKLNIDDELYPMDSSSYEYGDESTEHSQSNPPSLDKRIGVPMLFDEPTTTTSPNKGETTTLTSDTAPNEDKRPLFEQILSTTMRNSTKSLDFKRNNGNKTRKGVTKHRPELQPITLSQNHSSTVTPTTPTTTPATTPAHIPQQVSVVPASAVKNRLRNIISALGYSSIPTLAAGAAATWPYWAPMVAAATGRQNSQIRRRRRRENMDVRVPILPAGDPIIANLNHPEAPKSIIVDKDHIIHEETERLRLPKVGSERDSNSNHSSNFKMETSTRKEHQIDASDPKWIKVEVITESSPTLMDEPMPSGSGDVMNQNNSKREDEDNNRHFVQHGGEPQDVPLLKNFLKNVLSSEWNISTTTPSYYYPFSPTTATVTTPPPLSLSLSPLHLHSQEQILQTITSQQQMSSLIPFNPNKGISNDLKLKSPQHQQHHSSSPPLMNSVKTKTDVTNGRTGDYFTSSRQRNNRRLHKIEDVPDHSLDLNDDLTHDIGTADENPLVQSLTAMASSLTAEQSAENSSEKDVILSDDNSPSDQDTEASDVEQELEQQSSDENGTDEEVHPQMQSPTSESKTLSTSNFGSGWIDDLSSPNDNFAGRSSTTPKGLTTWSAVNGQGSQMIDNHSDDNTGFKGTVQIMPSDYVVSGVIGFNNKNPTAGSSTTKPTPTPIVTREIVDIDISTTEIPRTTKSNSVMQVRKKPPLLINNRYKQKQKPMPSKYVKTPPEDLVATEIGSDDTHTTFQLKQVEAKPPSSEMPTKYTRRPGYPWPINPPVITTPRTTMAQKKAAFQKIGTGGTKRPNPYLKRTELPKLSLTTPTSTPTPASTTVYYRTPGVPLVNAFPLTLSNMPFFDFIRSQILPRIGLSLISFMATSPLILTLLGASAVGGRKKREAVEDTDISVAFDMSKFLLEGDKEENGSTTVKKHGVLYETNSKDENSSPNNSSFFSLFSKHVKPSVTKSSIVKKTKEAVKYKYGKGT